MKTKEELNAIKEEVKTLNKKLAELNEEELDQITGGTVESYNKDVKNYLDALLNPEQAYRNTIIKKPTHVLPDES